MDSPVKSAFCELTALKFDILALKISTAVMWCLGLVSQSGVVEMLAGSLTGAMLMGWAFARLSNPPDAKNLRARWTTNVCFGIPIGIGLSYQYGGPDGLLPRIPGWAFAGIASGLSGAAFVFMVPICMPILAAIIRLGIEKKKEEVMKALNHPLPPDVSTVTTTGNTANQPPAGGAPHDAP